MDNETPFLRRKQAAGPGRTIEKIVVLGNSGTGKSTVSAKLAKEYDLEYISIDNFRKQYGNGTKDAELQARRQFIHSITKSEPQVIECTGYGSVGQALFGRLKIGKESVLAIILHATIQTCIRRIDARNKIVPFPQSSDEIQNFVERVDSFIESKALESYLGQLNLHGVLHHDTETDETNKLLARIDDVLNLRR